MDSNARKIFGNVVVTFVIGLTAGISPFLFIQLLPALLSPSLPIGTFNPLAIVITGTLIGAITSIIYATTFEGSKTQDVFFHALGIPAILIATVSSLSTQFNAHNEVSQVKDTASSMIQAASPSAEILPSAPQLLSPSATPQQHSYLGRTAWAAEKGQGRMLVAAQRGYLLVIGEYPTKDDAWAAYRRYTNITLRTERYVPKNLGVYELGPARYVLVYGRYPSATEADKVYRLLRVNDPQVEAKLLQY